MLVLNLPAFKKQKNMQPMTISMETVCMAKSSPRKNQLECLDLPCHIIIGFISPLSILSMEGGGGGVRGGSWFPTMLQKNVPGKKALLLYNIYY